MIAYAAPVPGFRLGALEPHPGDPSLVCVRKPNGNVLTVTPDGEIEERDEAGPWEGFRKGRTALLAERSGKIYVLPYAE